MDLENRERKPQVKHKSWGPVRRILTPLLLIVLVGCAAGDRAPDVPFTTLDGKQMSFGQLHGKVVLVNFWATSCPGCIAEMPKLTKLQQSFSGRGYQTVAVAMSYDPVEYVRNYTHQAKLPFLVTSDGDGKIAQAFGGIMATPTSFLLDKEGRIVRRYVGEPDGKEIASEIDARLRE